MVSRYGFSLYSENKISIAYARSLTKNLSIGGGFNYLSYIIDQYGTSSKFTFELGVQSQLSEYFSLGAYIFNPGSVRLTDSQDIPSRMGIGLKYSASDKADVYAEVEKTINRNLDIKFAVEYKLIESFSLRTGVNITQSSLHFGPRYTMKNGISILGGYSFDNRLGHTTSFSISYSK